MKIKEVNYWIKNTKYLCPLCESTSFSKTMMFIHLRDEHTDPKEDGLDHY